MGYVAAPVKETANSGWLWTWAWGIPKSSKNPDAAWKFISWASSKKFEQTVADKYGWAKSPTGKRNSTYSNTGYTEATAAYYKQEKAALDAADPTNPGVEPQPVHRASSSSASPSSRTSAPRCPQQIASAIAGKITCDKALADLAEARRTGRRGAPLTRAHPSPPGPAGRAGRRRSRRPVRPAPFEQLRSRGTDA